jgi:uncharacterized protein with gpF-like domain
LKKYDKEIMQAQLDNEKAVLKQLEGNYKDALEEINSKIAMLMGRADADMQHVIYQVEYQKALKKQIEGILLQLQTNEFDTVSGYLTKCYEEGFLGTMYSMQSQGVPLIFPIDQEEIAAAIQHETALTTSLYNAFDIKDLQKKIAGEISRGFSTGASYKEVARNVQAVTGIGKNKAVRIARTEGHRITETAAHNAQLKAKARGADVVKIWDATLDGKTRDSHMKADGEIKEVEEKFSNGLMFPGDSSGKPEEVINCRCRSRTDARWALEAEETKMLGDTSKMSDERKKEIADKLGIPVEDLDQYSGQIVPINAKSYSDFKKQYDQLWRYEGSALQQEAEARIAKLEQARTGKKSSEKSNKTIENSEKSDIIKSFEVGKSLGAAAKKYPVKLPESKQHTKLTEGQKIEGKAFAGKGTGKELRDRFRLESTYHIPASEWQKVSGKGYVIVGGKNKKAELHWYEAEGMIYEMKVKRFYDES